jgi:hypothetical protein
MRIIGESDYRNAVAILKARSPGLLEEIREILNNPEKLDLRARGGQRALSSQIQSYFVQRGWQKEARHLSIGDLRYDLMKSGVPIEVEISHERLLYADFFKFLIDYSNDKIPACVVIATENSQDFGHTWHNSRHKTMRKIEAISKFFLVPVLVIGISP